MKNIKEIDKEYVMNTYNRLDLLIEEGMGANCYDDNGKEYLDFGAGIGVNALGYCDIGWVSAVAKQACKLSHTSNLYYSEPCALLAQKLCERTRYSAVFFGNSGAEANECAIKLARKYSFDKYGAGRNKIITLVNSFHGRTMATLSATGQDVFHKYFNPFVEGFDYAQAGNIEDVKNKIKDGDVCAIMLEFIQGEGGVVALDKEFVLLVDALCKEKDILLIADEVQTGVGRTGRFLASEFFHVMPNITTLAKGLGGGLPIGAALCDGKLKNVLGYSMHGSTFGGNPIVCAGSLHVVEELSPQFLEDVRAKAKYLREQLSSINEIADISGIGLMVGLALKTKNAAEVVKECVKRGLIVLTAKDRVRLLPPLIITDSQIDIAVAVLKAVLDGANFDDEDNEDIEESANKNSCLKNNCGKDVDFFEDEHNHSGGDCTEDCNEELDEQELAKLKEASALLGRNNKE